MSRVDVEGPGRPSPTPGTTKPDPVGVDGPLPRKVPSTSVEPVEKSRLRRAFLAVHRWLTFLLGLVLVLAGGSGALLVYQYEIDYALNGDRYQPTPGDIGWREVRSVVRESYPEARLDLIWWPRWNAPVYEAHMERADGSFVTVPVDPGSGKILTGEREPNRVMDAVNSFHTTLLAGDAGYWLVILSTAAGLLLAVTGLYLWWPGIRRVLSGLRIRRGRSFYIFNYDLHQVVGTVGAPVVILMCATGLVMTVPDATTTFLHTVTGVEPPPEVYWTAVRSGPRPEGFSEADRPDPDEVLRRAHEEVPGAETFYITFPAEPEDPIHVRLQTGIDPKPFGIVSRLAYDQYTGELIQVVDPRRNRTRAKVIEEWIDPLHMGRFGGHLGRMIYVLVCASMLLLFVGGLYIWWEKRRRIARRALTGDQA